MRKKPGRDRLLAPLFSRQVTILGYGSQGQAQALNMRDSGITPVIGLPPGSRSRRRATADGFKVLAPWEATMNGDIVAVLIPDHKHKELFDSLAASRILKGKALIFAHGLSVAFNLVKPPSSCDVILVAPHGPGIRLREIYLKGKAFTAFWGIENDNSGRATAIAMAYATAIGCPPKRLFKSTFRDEAIGDIFGEQAVLCGGLTGLMETGFMTLVRDGLSPEAAYLECIHQLDLIIDLVKRHGPAGMLERISVTAAFGSLRSRSRLFDGGMSGRMKNLLREIKSGDFARNLLYDSRRGLPDYNRRMSRLRESLLQKTHDSIIRRLRDDAR